MIRNLLRRSRDEAGAAMITTVLVSAVLAGLGLAIVDVSMNNLQNAGRDRLAGTALGTSESGVAQAIEYIKSNGVAALYCSPNCGANPWGSQASPQTVTFPDGRKYRVWIEVVQHFDPPVYKAGTYKIHSHGTAGTGPGSRKVEVTVTAKPFEFPVGVYADSFADAGSASVHTEHMFSKGCIINRNAITFTSSTDPETGATYSNDPWYGFPPAAHSSSIITDKNNLSLCTPSNSVHTPTKCHPTYTGDQDASGASIAGTPCQNVTIGQQTSFFDNEMLNNTFGYVARGLSKAQYDALKAKAQSQGNYWTNATLGSYVPPCVNSCPAGKTPTPNGVLYFKLTAGTSIGNELSAISEFPRNTCGRRSLVIVVEGGDMHLNAGTSLTAAIFVPDGGVRFNGTATIEGTLFAKYVNKFNGTANFYLDECFIKNFPGGLFDVRPIRFREVDR